MKGGLLANQSTIHESTATLEHRPAELDGAASFSGAPRGGPEDNAARAGEVEPFRTPTGDLYADVPVGSRRETLAIRSGSMRSWLRNRHWQRFRERMRSGDVTEAVETLAAAAEFGPTVQPVHLRVASHAGALFLDLADDQGQVVEIRPDGWSIVVDPPVRFVRPPGMGALPVPVPGGTIEDLRPFLNLTDQDSWILVVGALVAAFRPSGPYPVLVISGEQGGSKSTTARALRRLIDPAASPLRAGPRNDRDLLVAARHSWIIALDNLSVISDRLSDALCRLATGGGLSTRTLFSNADETVLDACRPIIVNGIAELANRGDLRDRSIFLELPPIASERRRTEANYWADFDSVQPQILGALCDALSCALARVDKVTVGPLPRLADPTLWVTAAEPALGWPEGSFVGALARNRRDGLADTRDASPIVAPIRALAAAGPWSGSATALLARLAEFASAAARADPDWPKSPRQLTAQLQRLAPALRDAGLDWRRLPRTGDSRPHLITRLVTASSPADAVTSPDKSGAVIADDDDAADDGSDAPGSNRHPPLGAT